MKNTERDMCQLFKAKATGLSIKMDEEPYFTGI